MLVGIWHYSVLQTANIHVNFNLVNRIHFAGAFCFDEQENECNGHWLPPLALINLVQEMGCPFVVHQRFSRVMACCCVHTHLTVIMACSHLYMLCLCCSITLFINLDLGVFHNQLSTLSPPLGAWQWLTTIRIPIEIHCMYYSVSFLKTTVPWSYRSQGFNFQMISLCCVV